MAVWRSSSASAFALPSSSSAVLAASSICWTASRRASRADPLALGDRVGAQLLGLAAQPAGLLLELDRLGAVLLGVVLRRALELLGDVVRLGAQPVRLGLGLAADPLGLLGGGLGGRLGLLGRLVQDVLGGTGGLARAGRRSPRR